MDPGDMELDVGCSMAFLSGCVSFHACMLIACAHEITHTHTIVYTDKIDPCNSIICKIFQYTLDFTTR